MEDAESGDPGNEQDDAEPKQHGIPFPTGSATRQATKGQATNDPSVWGGCKKTI
jgi:hypothetical protein